MDCHIPGYAPMLFWAWTAIVLHSITMATQSTMEQEDKGTSTAARSCREFSSNLHKVTAAGANNYLLHAELAVARKTTGNLVSSPLSAHLALSCLFHGSDNATAREMRAGLCLTDTERLHEEYRRLAGMLKSTEELSLVNAIFVQEGVELIEAFSTRGKDFYNFQLSNVDFRDNARAAGTINSWAAKSTEDRIKNIMGPDDIDEYTRLVLASAVYFKGQWRHRFDAAKTELRTFHSTTTRSMEVPTMFQESKFHQGEIPALNSRFLVVPYAEENIDMIIVLPNEIEGLRHVEEHFDWNVIVNAAGTKRSTQLYLPKFKIEATLDLKNVLVELGLTSMFDDTADFTKMSVLPLKVDNVLQKAFIEVNELGTEAAAVTVVRMRMKRSLGRSDEVSNEFIVDRPFVVAIRHVPDNVPLFFASVRNLDPTRHKDEL